MRTAAKTVRVQIQKQDLIEWVPSEKNVVYSRRIGVIISLGSISETLL